LNYSSPLKAISYISLAFKKTKLFPNKGEVTEFGQIDHISKGRIIRLIGSRL